MPFGINPADVHDFAGLLTSDQMPGLLYRAQAAIAADHAEAPPPDRAGGLISAASGVSPVVAPTLGGDASAGVLALPGPRGEGRCATVAGSAAPRAAGAAPAGPGDGAVGDPKGFRSAVGSASSRNPAILSQAGNEEDLDIDEVWVLVHYVGDPLPWHHRARLCRLGGSIWLCLASDLHFYEPADRAVVVDYEGIAAVQALLFGAPGFDSVGTAEGRVWVWCTPAEH